MRLPSVALVLFFLISFGFIVFLLPGEIARERVDKRLKDLGKRRTGPRIGTWQDDMDALCDRHLGRYRFYVTGISRMQQAGYLSHWHTGAYLVGQVCSVFAGLIAAFALVNFDFRDLQSSLISLVEVLVVISIFSLLPWLWLKLKIAENVKRLRKTMPVAVELMTICMESGNGLEQTFEKVGNELLGSSPQIATRLLDVRSGMVAYDRKWALEKLEKESFLEEEKELARALLESLRYGTPLTDALRALAQRMREENMNRLEELAGKASTKMTLPMVLFLMLPVLVIMMAEPILTFFRRF